MNFILYAVYYVVIALVGLIASTYAVRLIPPFSDHTFDITHILHSKKMTFKWVLVVLIGIAVSVSSYVLLKNLQNKLIVSQENQKIIDENQREIERLKIQADLKEKAKRREANILGAVQEYFDASLARDTVRLDTSFIFPINRFFYLQNTPKWKFNERMRFHWNHRTDYYFKADSVNTQIVWDFSDSVKVIVGLAEMQGRSITEHIKLNKDLKIYYLRDFINMPRDSLLRF